MPTTSPDNISYPDISTVQDQPAYMSAHASSVQAALAMRQRYTYVWANAAARTAQTGMTPGSTAYQLDTRSEYKFESGVWRLATPHVEFTCSATNVVVGSVTPIGNFTVDTNRTTASNIATPISSGTVQIADSGIYAVSSNTYIGASATGRSFIQVADLTTSIGMQRTSIGVGEDEGSLSVPNAYLLVAGTQLQFTVYQTTGATRTVTSRTRITRIG